MKVDLVWNNLQCLMCHKTKPSKNTEPPKSKFQPEKKSTADNIFFR